MHILHPVDISLGEALGHKLDGAVLHDADGLLGKRLHLHEPLCGDEGLDIVVAAVAGADVVGVRLGLDEVALLLKVLDDGIAALVAVHAVVGAAVFVDGAVVGDNADDLKVVAQADLEVVRVVGGGHLDRARAEADLAVFVAHDLSLIHI